MESWRERVCVGGGVGGGIRGVERRARARGSLLASVH